MLCAVTVLFDTVLHDFIASFVVSYSFCLVTRGLSDTVLLCIRVVLVSRSGNAVVLSA